MQMQMKTGLQLATYAAFFSAGVIIRDMSTTHQWPWYLYLPLSAGIGCMAGILSVLQNLWEMRLSSTE